MRRDSDGRSARQSRAAASSDIRGKQVGFEDFPDLLRESPTSHLAPGQPSQRALVAGPCERRKERSNAVSAEGVALSQLGRDKRLSVIKYIGFGGDYIKMLAQCTQVPALGHHRINTRGTSHQLPACPDSPHRAFRLTLAARKPRSHSWPPMPDACLNSLINYACVLALSSPHVASTHVKRRHAHTAAASLFPHAPARAIGPRGLELFSSHTIPYTTLAHVSRDSS